VFSVSIRIARVPSIPRSEILCRASELREAQLHCGAALQVIGTQDAFLNRSFENTA